MKSTDQISTNDSQILIFCLPYNITNATIKFELTTIETGDRLRISWFSISRDRFEYIASLGHIYTYPRSPLNYEIPRFLNFVQTGIPRGKNKWRGLSYWLLRNGSQTKPSGPFVGRLIRFFDQNFWQTSFSYVELSSSTGHRYLVGILA